MQNKELFAKNTDAWIDAHAEEIIKELQGFARIRSVSRADLGAPGAPFGPECKKMLDYALLRCAAQGFDVEDCAGYFGTATLGDPDHAIGFFAHLDVVPEGDKWIYPPYAATRVGDFLIGRGVSDNKGAAIMILFVMKMFKEMGITLNHGLKLVMGCSEETGMQDMEHFNATQKSPVFSMVTDAGFPVNYAQKGSLKAHLSIPIGEPLVSFAGGEVDNMVPPYAEALINADEKTVRAGFKKAGAVMNDFEFSAEGTTTRIIAHGIAKHAAAPEGGKSAIHILADALAGADLLSGAALDAMAAISRLTGNYYGEQAGIACEDPETGKTTMVIGVARTEAEHILVHIDCRLSLATDLDGVQAQLKQYAAENGFTTELIQVTSPVCIPKDDPAVVALQDVYKAVSGRDDPPYTMGGGTYSRCLKNAVTFGPGRPGATARPADLPENHGGAHGPDEYTYIPDMLWAMKLYARAIVELDGIIE